MACTDDPSQLCAKCGIRHDPYELALRRAVTFLTREERDVFVGFQYIYIFPHVPELSMSCFVSNQFDAEDFRAKVFAAIKEKRGVSPMSPSPFHANAS